MTEQQTGPAGAQAHTDMPSVVFDPLAANNRPRAHSAVQPAEAHDTLRSLNGASQEGGAPFNEANVYPHQGAPDERHLRESAGPQGDDESARYEPELMGLLQDFETARVDLKSLKLSLACNALLAFFEDARKRQAAARHRARVLRTLRAEQAMWDEVKSNAKSAGTAVPLLGGVVCSILISVMPGWWRLLAAPLATTVAFYTWLELKAGNRAEMAVSRIQALCTFFQGLPHGK